MPYLDARVLDRGLESLVTETTRLTINPSQPIDYAEAIAAMLGQRNLPLVTGPSNALPSGRKATVEAFSTGSVTVAGTATHWCLVDDNGQRLLASAPLANPLLLAAGNAFTLTAFDIIMPGA